MDALSSVALGIGLAAACGFRVFAPLLGLSLAHRAGLDLPLADGFGWAQTDMALTLLAVATVLEVLAYFIPFIDNALDTVATPAAMVAGVGASASVLGDFSPVMQWGLAAVAGGGASGLVQGGTVAARGASRRAPAGWGTPSWPAARRFCRFSRRCWQSLRRSSRWSSWRRGASWACAPSGVAAAAASR